MAMVETPEDEPEYFRKMNTMVRTNFPLRYFSPQLYYKSLTHPDEYCAVDGESEWGQMLYVQYPRARFWCVWDKQDFLMEYRAISAKDMVWEQSERLSIKQLAEWQSSFWANQIKRWGTPASIIPAHGSRP